MCGISGIFSKSLNYLEVLPRMASLMKHRGPDDEGYLLFSHNKARPLAGPETVKATCLRQSPYSPEKEFAPSEKDIGGLAHRRLSIIDLSPNGHQPMTRNGKTWLVYNGEVYNYVELRQELKGKGIQFQTESDSEVVLAAYDNWGTDCFNKFNGMWAMAILDVNRRKALFSRDRFGIKPLYFHATDQAFSFASEIKCFEALPNWSAQASLDVIHEFLFQGISDHTASTFFKGVMQLLPGHFMELDVDAPPRSSEEIVSRNWYSLSSSTEYISGMDGIEELRTLFLDSVRMRMRTDVPLGSCLSGGVDSSSIVGAMTHLHPQAEIRTVTACSKHAKFDESHYADEVVRFTGASACKVYPDPDQLLVDIDKLVRHQDEPFGSTSIYAQWKVFEEAKRNGLTVMLDGQGADETHCGYSSFLRPYVKGLLRQFKFSRAWKDLCRLRPNLKKSASSLWRGFLDASIPENWQLDAALGRRENNLPLWYHGKARLSGGISPGVPKNLNAYISNMVETSVRMLLHWEDRNSMAHSIEARVPFLDYRIPALMLTLADHEKIKEGWTKSTLRHAMRGLVPKNVLFRKDKMAFATPESIWIRGNMGEAFSDELVSACSNWGGLFGPELIKEFKEVRKGQKTYEFIYWKIVCLERWRQVFRVKV